MMLFYEDAAHLLCQMNRRQLSIVQGVRAEALNIVISKMAIHMYAFFRDEPTHADAAIGMLDDILATHTVRCKLSDRAKLIALIGTILANMQARRRS